MSEEKINLELFTEPNPSSLTSEFEVREEVMKEREVIKEEVDAVFQKNKLSLEEMELVNSFAEKIDIKNSSMIMQYGLGAQKKMADFSESALENVSTKDLGELGGMLSEIAGEIRGFEDEEDKKMFFGLFKKPSQGGKLASLKAKFQKAESTIEIISSKLESHQIQLMKDVSILDKMYELNKTYFKELTMYVLAGEKKLEEARNIELPNLLARARQSGLPEDAQEANDYVSLCDRFEKKIHDLELTRMISLQTAPQIRMIQNNDTLMAEKIMSTIVNTIPLWKNQMVLSLGINHSTQAANAQRAISDMTNEMLKQNAQTLKMATVETARENERSIVDIETIRVMNDSLVSMLDEVKRIQEEGRQKRKGAKGELIRIEGELKQKLLEARSGL